MAITREEWSAVIQDLLFQTNLNFINFATRQDEYIDAKQVNLPQAGGGISVEKNYSGSFPMPVSQRTDTVTSYTVDEYLTNVMIVRYSENLQLSYDKLASVVRQQSNILAQVIGTDVLYQWALPTDSGAIYTTGATSSDWLTGSQTGTRKLITVKDIIRLKNKFDVDNVPSSGRYLMLPSIMYNSLLNDSDVKVANAFYGYSGQAVLPEGNLPTVLDFTILQRPDVVVYTSGATVSGTNTKKVPTATGGYTVSSTDNLAGIAFHADMVATAFGGVEVSLGLERDPQYGHGQPMSALAMLGASRLREDGKGVAMLIMGA